VETLEDILGLGADSLAWWQMLLRAALVYLAALAMVRVGEKRFLGKSTAFDVILGIVLGSVISGAITGSSAFFATLVAGFTLVTLHWLFAFIAFRSDRFGDVVKGRSRVLVEKGEIDWDEMRNSNISYKDLMSRVRLQAQFEDLEQVQVARLERSGDLSVIPVDDAPKVLEVRVEEGVQIVRIQLE